MKAVIVDLEGQRAAALCEDGSVQEVANQDYSLGQEIEIRETSQETKGNEKRQKRAVIRKWYRSAAAAAALVLMLAGIGGVSVYAMPYGEVNLEGDTSVVYTINRFDYVIGAKASDETGEQILEEVGKENLINHKIEKAVEVTLEHIQEEEGSGTDVEYHIRTDISSGESDADEAHAEALQGKLEKVLEEKAPVKPEGSEGEQVTPLDSAPEEYPEPADPEPASEQPQNLHQETKQEAQSEPEPGRDSGSDPENGQEIKPAEQPDNSTANMQDASPAGPENMPEDGAQDNELQAPEGQFEGMPGEEPENNSSAPGEPGGAMNEMPR